MNLSSETLWLIIGFTGQVFFSARFLIQWLHSERHKRSLIPLAFWYFSVLGSLTLLTYAIYRQDPVFIWGVQKRPICLIFLSREMDRLKEPFFSVRCGKTGRLVAQVST
jgi:lipid-A-disaccharide synthase-like uncharacterized protein